MPQANKLHLMFYTDISWYFRYMYIYLPSLSIFNCMKTKHTDNNCWQGKLFQDKLSRRVCVWYPRYKTFQNSNSYQEI